MQTGLTRAKALRAVSVVSASLLVAACGSLRDSSTPDPKLGVSASKRVVDTNKPIPKGGGVYKIERPYKIAGTWYYPREDTTYDKVGVASWYGDDFHGRQTANGEVYDMHALSAAHPTLPLPTYARVTNVENGKSVVVRVNDRGPFAHDRLIDLSARTAKILDFSNRGLTKVRVQYVGRAPLEGDDTWLTTTYAEAGQTAPIPASRIASDERPTDGRHLSAITSTGSVTGVPDILSAFTPDWAAGTNRVAEAFAAIDTARSARSGPVPNAAALILNDPLQRPGD